MKSTRYPARMIALMLSLMLLLGMIPALATEAEPRINEENLLSEFEAANSPEQLLQRHATFCRHEDIYSRGELFFTDDMYVTAESAYYFFGEDYIRYITPTSDFDALTDDGISTVLMTPEENAAEMRANQSYFSFTEHEVLQSFEEQDGELLFTTKISDADGVRDYLEMKQAVFGEGFETDYGDGTEVICQYRADAADLTAFDLFETVRLPDGSELPVSHASCTYDEAVPDPAAPDSVLAPAFDETGETLQITVVFASGTPQEQTCLYTVPDGIQVYIYYNGEYISEVYADAECTQPFEDADDKKEFTMYVKAAGE